jgi:hypothetical protein
MGLYGNSYFIVYAPKVGFCFFGQFNSILVFKNSVEMVWFFPLWGVYLYRNSILFFSNIKIHVTYEN